MNVGYCEARIEGARFVIPAEAHGRALTELLELARDELGYHLSDRGRLLLGDDVTKEARVDRDPLGKDAQLTVAFDDHSRDIVQVHCAVQAKGLVDIVTRDLRPSEVGSLKFTIAKEHQRTVVDPSVEAMSTQARDRAAKGEQ